MRQPKISLSPLLRRIKFYFDALAKTSDCYLFVADLANNVVMVSPNLVEDFELPGTVMRDMEPYWRPIIHPADRDNYIQSIEDVFVHKRIDTHDIEYRVMDRRGEYVWIHCCGSLSYNKEGNPFMFTGQMFRMGRRNQADELTGLLNKYQFDHAVKVALNEYRMTGQGGAVLIVGLDNFKIINETFNRYFGNQVLKLFAKEIKNILPPEFTLFRLDGDEFGVVFPGATEDDVEKLFKSMQTCMSRGKEIQGKKFFCTISGGTVFYPQAGKDAMVLHKHAEAALDMAKRDGKNRNCVFSREQYNRWVRSLTMRDYLKSSIENDCSGFSLLYQPQINTKNRSIFGAEALLRWRNPRGKMVAPMEFVPVLEDTKMIVPLGKWIVAEALKTCKCWQEIIPDFHMSINVSYEQLKDPTFTPFVVQQVKAMNLKPRTVLLELTESKIVADWTFLNQQFDLFRENGVGIAMDDFGTGYSSLSYLKNLSCDIIKIDREFVKRILENEFDCRLVEYTVNLCHYAGIAVCIEGVESDEEYDMLTSICQADCIQGYLFGRPEEKTVFEEKFLNIQKTTDAEDDSTN